jgi:hypothetical protein
MSIGPVKPPRIRDLCVPSVDTQRLQNPSRIDAKTGK